MVGVKNCQGNSQKGPENIVIKLGMWQIKLISKYEMLEPSPGGPSRGGQAGVRVVVAVVQLCSGLQSPVTLSQSPLSLSSVCGDGGTEGRATSDTFRLPPALQPLQTMSLSQYQTKYPIYAM